MKGIFKKARKKRCSNCKYLHKNDPIFACFKSGIYIEPIKIICFKKEKKDGSNNKPNNS